MRPIEERISAALDVAQLDVVLVPGLRDSGATHWQTEWNTRFPDWLRVSQSRWDVADLDSWIDAIERSLAFCSRPALLVAHSFGALASAVLAERQSAQIAAAFLVAPADPARFSLQDRLPTALLSVPSTLIASRNDPWLRFETAGYWAQRWGSRLHDQGLAGHINADSGFGPWPQGLEWLAELIDQIREPQNLALPAARVVHNGSSLTLV